MKTQPQVKLCYRWDTKPPHPFLCTEWAQSDQRNPGQWLMAPDCTFDLPPMGNEYRIPCRQDSTWVILPDFRSARFWWKADGSPVAFVIGQTPDETMTPIPPPVFRSMWDDDLGGWMQFIL